MTNIKDTLDSIRTRRTLKVLSKTPLAVKPRDENFIKTLIESAYYAPQHYPCFAGHQQHLSSPLPWRFYVLDSATCRQLAQKLADLPDAGKMPGMLNTADYLIQTTWCPLPMAQATTPGLLFDGNLVNMEHIAAAGAAAQNLLLTATALGRENYWGSGGPLREAFAYEWLGIPTAEILIGSLFIFPSESEVADDSVMFKTSERRNQRGALEDSYRFVAL